jgi:hypothetical protein
MKEKNGQEKVDFIYLPLKSSKGVIKKKIEELTKSLKLDGLAIIPLMNEEEEELLALSSSGFVATGKEIENLIFKVIDNQEEVLEGYKIFFKMAFNGNIIGIIYALRESVEISKREKFQIEVELRLVISTIILE